MATVRKKIDYRKKPNKPDWEESEFAKTIDGQIMVMLNKAVTNGHFIEAQVLSWSTIEQILLPRLIGWIAKALKVNLPKEIYKLNPWSINFIYLCISHDEDLYKQLEESRRKRNMMIHKLILLGDIKLINKFAGTCTKENILLQEAIVKRFKGEVLVPSINLYRNGWNSATEKISDMIKKKI